MHDKFLEFLREIADIHLVSRLKNERLGFPSRDDIRLFLPDIHLISDERNEAFKYGTNHTDLLAEVADGLINFKKEMEEEKTVVVYQLGDFMDPWRETPAYWSIGGKSDAWEASIQQILDDNSTIITRLRHPDLRTQFVFGNHDIDLHWLPSFAEWKLKFFFPIDPEKGPSAVALHGDILTMFEKQMPDWLQYLAVYLFGPSVKPTVRNLGRMRDEIIKAHNKRKYTNYIQQPVVPGLDSLIAVKDDPLPDEHNVKRRGTAAEEELKYLKEAKDMFFELNEEMEWNLSMAVIGHSHHARIAVDETDDQFFALIDCGAWIERCSGVVEGEEIEMDCAQIGVLTDNDARIYQLGPKTT